MSGFCQVTFISVDLLRHSSSLAMIEALTTLPSKSTQERNLPPNRLTPMMLNINQKTRQTSSTLKMAGIAWIRAFTTTCKRSAALRRGAAALEPCGVNDSVTLGMDLRKGEGILGDRSHPVGSRDEDPIGV